jgi:hypothetical protein
LDQSKRKKATVVEKIAKDIQLVEEFAGKVGVLNLAGHHDGMRHNRMHMYTPRQRVNGLGTGTLRKVLSGQ